MNSGGFLAVAEYQITVLCLKMPLGLGYIDASTVLHETTLKVITLRFSHTSYDGKKYLALTGQKPRNWWLSQKVISAG